MRFPAKNIDKQLFLFKICGGCGDILPSDDNSGVDICCSCLGKILQEALNNFKFQVPIWKDRK